MTDAAARLRATEPATWRDTASAWRSWASAAGRWAAELRSHAARLAAIWTGSAAAAVTTRLIRLIHRLTVFRLGCWAADQALSEFAADLARGRAMLAAAGESGVARQAILSLVARSDAATCERLNEQADTTTAEVGSTPPCTATPAEVQRWWQTLSPAQRREMLATRPGWVGAADGVPAGVRDLANRLTLEEAPGLDRLKERLDDGRWPRPYLMQLDTAQDGRAVVALGDPDRAGAVLTQVPGMTADLESFGKELARAERIAVRATELTPGASTSAILWLGYDAPDFVDEAANRSRAEAGAAGLRRFQDGLRATHLGEPAHQTLLGHSYGSLVVGEAAAERGLAADDVVFVGSPGVGVDSAAELHGAPAGRVWSSTSYTDVIQWAAVSPKSLVEDLIVGQAVPGGALTAFARPENDLFYGTNPSDPAFGARVFASRPDAGHDGYWNAGSESLDTLAAITTGQGDVIPR
ncbi:alpha/beta hydrolase [Actinoplanes friuliensis]|uniref:DUF1023 domain-containing protein n=1 Tax=Actinoplanes friuliensis DSM 7358 TaxID=1246995 RepID=U5VR18_9ACTN|nr:alpha/beta hydrolase [Actinoplanes friuliensis]AGZ39252.1 hypothetical protein AFR_04815 [Actinoplanes friuliensis DSM 7358]